MPVDEGQRLKLRRRQLPAGRLIQQANGRHDGGIDAQQIDQPLQLPRTPLRRPYPYAPAAR